MRLDTVERSMGEVTCSAQLSSQDQAAGAPINSGLHFFGNELAPLAGVS